MACNVIDIIMADNIEFIFGGRVYIEDIQCGVNLGSVQSTVMGGR